MSSFPLQKCKSRFITIVFCIYMYISTCIWFLYKFDEDLFATLYEQMCSKVGWENWFVDIREQMRSDHTAVQITPRPWGQRPLTWCMVWLNGRNSIHVSDLICRLLASLITQMYKFYTNIYTFYTFWPTWSY